MSNIAMPYVPGPSQIFVSTGTSGAFEYLGQAETDVRISIHPEWEDVFVDGAGSRVPFDSQFMGESGSVSFDLIYYHELTLLKLKKWLNGLTGTAGSGPAGTIGTLAKTENYRYQLVIQSLYAGKAPYAANGMVGGYWFKFVRPVGSWDVSPSTRVKKERVSFDWQPIFDLLGGYDAYSNDLTSLTLPTPT